ncbi:sulfur carrier protein ThiS [Desulfoscipio geothermicus]|uniref:Sulfur carrier protein n=1 Tax=Desulfoscipio geothermicus DSM 3669 TaxID=1121426 RepID=A0A1I6CQ89_9FIRM|nr:sulfur carrier protein ThiS [Desulfoscipio geothermicus]SFQ95279.1 sulfur carrier protein [Desulfoscipio geothermicus DSM 3669]
MKIFLNGKIADFVEGSSIADLVVLKKLNSNYVIVEYNNQIVQKDSWPEIQLKNEDKIEIFQLVGGG